MSVLFRRYCTSVCTSTIPTAQHGHANADRRFEFVRGVLSKEANRYEGRTQYLLLQSTFLGMAMEYHCYVKRVRSITLGSLGSNTTYHHYLPSFSSCVPSTPSHFCSSRAKAERVRISNSHAVALGLEMVGNSAAPPRLVVEKMVTVFCIMQALGRSTKLGLG